MQYPGRIIKVGEQDAVIVKALKQCLNEVLAAENDPSVRLDPDDPNFGPKMKQAVLLFQTRHVDGEGKPLKQDGEVGSHTWEALFGADSVPSTPAPASALLAQVLTLAAAEEAKKVREIPVNSNRGPDVEKYLASVGLPGGYAWCCSFVYWCFKNASAALGVANPMVQTGGCLDHWQRAPGAGANRIMASAARNDPGLLAPGMIFIIDHGGGMGHTGLVESVSGGYLTTIEGNTDASKTREGGGVYRLTRNVGEINKGFIVYPG